MKIKNPTLLRNALFFALILLGIFFISTYLMNIDLVVKKVTFTLLSSNAPNQVFPGDVSQWLFEKNQELILKVPQTIWWQDAQRISMTIAPTEPLKQLATSPGKYDFFYEVRLDLNKAQFLTGDTIFEPINLNRTAYFQWQFFPQTNTNLVGTVWVFFHITEKATGIQWQYPRLAIPLRISVVDFLGMSISSARILIVIFALTILIFLFVGKYLPRWSRRKRG